MKLAVYCASSMGTDPAYAAFARELGQWIGSHGHTLVYGGGDSGLMGELAQAAFSAGSQVIGVLPGNVDFICSRPQPWCTGVIKTPDMSERKRTMLELADACLALPGGIGTLDEITEAITLSRIGVKEMPCILLNVNGFYEPMRQMTNAMEQAGFIQPGTMGMVHFTDDLTKLASILAGTQEA